MAFFNSAVNVLQTLVITLGAGLGVWGVINLLEGYTTATTTPAQRARESSISYPNRCNKNMIGKTTGNTANRQDLIDKRQYF